MLHFTIKPCVVSFHLVKGLMSISCSPNLKKWHDLVGLTIRWTWTVDRNLHPKFGGLFSNSRTFSRPDLGWTRKKLTKTQIDWLVGKFRISKRRTLGGYSGLSMGEVRRIVSISLLLFVLFYLYIRFLFISI